MDEHADADMRHAIALSLRDVAASAQQSSPSIIDLTADSEDSDDGVVVVVAADSDDATRRKRARGTADDAARDHHVESDHGNVNVKRVRGPAPAHLQRLSPPPAVVSAVTGMAARGVSSTAMRAITTPPLTPLGRLALNALPVLADGRVNSGALAVSPSSSTTSFHQLLATPAPIDALLLSSYVADPAWLVAQLSSATTLPSLALVTILLDGRMCPPRDMLALTRLRVKLAYPPLTPLMAGGHCCMHAKFMLIWYAGGLRVVVGSGNLIGEDWGERGAAMENVWWWQDFPEVRGHATTLPPSTFGWDLVKFMRQLQVVPAHIERLMDGDGRLLRYDFSTATATLVASVNGKRSGEWSSMDKCSGYNDGVVDDTDSVGDSAFDYGLLRLLSVVERMMGEQWIQTEMVAAPASSTSSVLPRLTYQTSSIGNASLGFLQDFYHCASGNIDAMRKTNRSTGPPTHTATHHNLARHFAILFPSMATVLGSECGPHGAGTICFNGYWDEESVAAANLPYRPAKFPREMMVDCVSMRRGALMHVKMGLCLGLNGEGWCYSGYE